MPNRERMAGILLVAAVAVLIVGWAACFVRSALRRRRWHPRQASETVIPLRRLARREILPIATGGRLTALGASALAGLLLTGSLFLGGRFGGATALGMAGTLVALAAILGFVIWRDCVRPLKPLLDRRAAFPWGVRFRYVDGAWQYADDEWFVRVEQDAACALHALELDLSRPIRYSALLTVDNGGRAVRPIAFSTVLVAQRSGGTYAGKTGYSAALERWILDRGGAFDQTE